MSDDITRKDFLNAVLLGTGASLLRASAPGVARAIEAAADHAVRTAPAPDDWTGPGGVGDYAASNGNTKAVMDAAHAAIRDAGTKPPPSTTDTGEVYDLVVVGGGITGLTAAYFFARQTGNAKTCLVIDDHPIFGGEAKQNEFVVNGVRLIAPQGSNDFGVPRAGSGWQDDVWTDLNMPRQFAFSRWESAEPELRFAQDNYQPMEGVGEYGTDIAYFFGAKGWRRNIWQSDLADAPFTDDVKRDLVKWRNAAPVTNGLAGEQFARFLDTMSYKQ